MDPPGEYCTGAGGGLCASTSGAQAHPTTREAAPTTARVPCGKRIAAPRFAERFECVSRRASQVPAAWRGHAAAARRCRGQRSLVCRHPGAEGGARRRPENGSSSVQRRPLQLQKWNERVFTGSDFGTDEGSPTPRNPVRQASRRTVCCSDLLEDSGPGRRPGVSATRVTRPLEPRLA